jgi:hypothetical protein
MFLTTVYATLQTSSFPFRGARTMLETTTSIPMLKGMVSSITKMCQFLSIIMMGLHSLRLYN